MSLDHIQYEWNFIYSEINGDVIRWTSKSFSKPRLLKWFQVPTTADRDQSQVAMIVFLPGCCQQGAFGSILVGLAERVPNLWSKEVGAQPYQTKILVCKCIMGGHQEIRVSRNDPDKLNVPGRRIQEFRSFILSERDLEYFNRSFQVKIAFQTFIGQRLPKLL